MFHAKMGTVKDRKGMELTEAEDTKKGWQEYSESESEVAQSCPTLWDPMNCSLPGLSVHGIFQARVLEWVAISFSRGSSWPKDWIWVSHTVGRCFALWATRECQHQRIARKDKKSFLREQCKEIEGNNGREKTRDLFKKIRDSKGTVHARMGSIKEQMVWT